MLRPTRAWWSGWFSMTRSKSVGSTPAMPPLYRAFRPREALWIGQEQVNCVKATLPYVLGVAISRFSVFSFSIYFVRRKVIHFWDSFFFSCFCFEKVPKRGGWVLRWACMMINAQSGNHTTKKSIKRGLKIWQTSCADRHRLLWALHHFHLPIHNNWPQFYCLLSTNNSESVLSPALV